MATNRPFYISHRLYLCHCLTLLNISIKLKGLAQANIIKKLVILFWLINMTIHLYNVGPKSKTLSRRCTNVIQMFCVCWVTTTDVDLGRHQGMRCSPHSPQSAGVSGCRIRSLWWSAGCVHKTAERSWRNRHLRLWHSVPRKTHLLLSVCIWEEIFNIYQLNWWLNRDPPTHVLWRFKLDCASIFTKTYNTIQLHVLWL